MKVPATVGVPLMVIVLEAQAAVTPAGRPVGVPIPVPPAVVWVMSGRAVLMHTVGEEEAADTVLASVTEIVPVADTLPQPPISGML